MVTVKSDAGQKFQNTLLERFDTSELVWLKRANWGGIVTETERLYSTMLHDWDVLQKDSTDIEKAVKSLDWSVMPWVAKGEKVTPQAEEVAKVVEDALWHRASVGAGEFGHTFSQLLGVLCHAIFRGQNVHQIIWKNEGYLIYPARFEQLAPQYLQWEMAPGKVDRLLLVPDGEAAKPVPFPQYKFIVALNNTGPDHPLYNASYYSLVAWFSAFKKGLGWFMEFCQQYGLPKPVFHYDNPEDKEALIRDLNDKRVINAILLEGDRSVDWANVPAGGQSLPQRELLNMAEAAVHKAILGQTLTSDVSKSGGSLAQAKVHAGVQADTVMRYAEFVQEVVNSQLIPAIVHLNYGKTDVPMPELRCKLPQAVANIERAQFWGQVLQIPGMQVVKSDVYDSLGIAMPGEGDETLQAPSQEAGAAGGLLAALQGGGKGKERKDEVALAARAKGDEHMGIAGWLAPLKKKLLEAKKAGASFDELKQMMLEARLNTHALAGAMEENIRQGFYGDEDELEAANPYGCNQYGHGFTKECGRGGGRGGQKTFDFFDSVKKDEDKDRFKQNREQRENEKAYKEAEANYLTECSNLDSLGKELDDWQKPEEKWGGGIDLNTLMGRYKEQFEKTKEARLKQAEAARKAGKKLNFYDGKDESLYEIDSQLWNKYEDVFNEDDELKAASAEDCEDVEAGKKRLNNPVPQADGKRCYTENCSWHKGTTRESKLKNVNNTPKLAPADADTNEKEKALRDGIAWVLKNRKPLYGVCYVKSVNENGKEELVPLDLHVEDIEHAMAHEDIAKELWKTIGRGQWIIRDTETDEVYRNGRVKVVLRDYSNNGEKRKRIVTHYKDKRKDEKR